MVASSPQLYHEKLDFTPYEQTKLIQRDIAFQSTSNINKFSFPQYDKSNNNISIIPESENIKSVDQKGSDVPELPSQNASEIILPDTGQAVKILSEQSKVDKIDIPVQRVAEKLSDSTNNENIASSNSNNNVNYIKPNLKTDLINKQIHSSVDNPIVLSNNSLLEIRAANDHKDKGQTLIVTNKMLGRNSSSQQNLNSNNTDNNIKHLFSKSMADEWPKISEDNDNIALSAEHKTDNKTDENIVTNTKIDSSDFSGNSAKQNEIENNSNNNNPQNENSGSLDPTKLNQILVNSGEPIRDVIQKNTNDTLVEKTLVSGIQSSIHTKGIEMAPQNNIKSSAQLSNDSVQSNFSKVKAEDLVKEIHKVLTNEDSKKVILNLQPEDLGKVKIEFDIKEKSMNARISVETESAKNLIQSNSETLRNSLHDSGITLSSFNVLLSDGSRQQHVPILKKKIQKNESIDTHVEQVRPNRRNLGYNTYEYLA
jgi:flagellar hook-length control protein FliK